MTQICGGIICVSNNKITTSSTCISVNAIGTECNVVGGALGKLVETTTLGDPSIFLYIAARKIRSLHVYRARSGGHAIPAIGALSLVHETISSVTSSTFSTNSSCRNTGIVGGYLRPIRKFSKCLRKSQLIPTTITAANNTPSGPTRTICTSPVSLAITLCHLHAVRDDPREVVQGCVVGAELELDQIDHRPDRECVNRLVCLC